MSENKNNGECECGQLPDILDVEDGPTGFTENLTEVSKSTWLTLTQCPKCKQYWRVDKWDKLQRRFAIKLKTDEGWEEKDTVPLQKEFLIENRGGVTEEECMRVDCHKNRVKDSAYCVDHLYETGLRK